MPLNRKLNTSWYIQRASYAATEFYIITFKAMESVHSILLNKKDKL